MPTRPLLFVAFLLIATACAAAAAPIIIRHDRDEAAYFDLGRRYAATLCHARNSRGIVDGEGTLIAPRWVLTAAHVARDLRAGQILEVGGTPYPIDRVVLHPRWKDRQPGDDLALVRLAQAVAGVEPAPLYRAEDEAGQEIVVVGAGMRGTGLTGPVEDDGRVRGATNRVDEVSERWLRFAFDAPEAENTTNLEGISGPGDSGGPAFIVVEGRAYVAGVSSGQSTAATGGKPGRYGVTEYYTRVSQYAAWIDQTMRAEDAGPDDDLADKLDAFMNRLAAQGFSGGLLVAKDGAVVLSKGYGMADRARGVPFSSETVFPVGSVTKQFTGAAILKLEMMGLLHVEDPITTYFDGVPEDKAGITLHHLLTHSAGFPDALGFDLDAISRDDYVAQALGAALLFAPGTDYAYSNVGYSLLAAVVEYISGGSYDAFVQEHLFKPAGMSRTGYVLSRWQPDDLAHGYRDDQDWGTFADKPWADDGPYWHLRGNGGLHATLGDLYKWHLALEGDAVLSAAAKEKYYAPHVEEGEGNTSFYGYGWSIVDTPRGRLITHNGGNPYFSSDFLRYTDAGVVIYVVSNTSSHRAFRFSRTIADIVFGAPYELPPETIETLSKAALAETPLGRRALAYLALLEAGEAAIPPFLEEHLAPRVREKYSMEDLVGQFKGDQQEIGAVDVARIAKTGAHELELTVQAKATGQWWLLRVIGEPEAPYQLAGLGVVNTMPPADTGPATTVTREAGPAADGGDDRWGLPGSPTGRALAALLTAIDKGDDAHTRQFVETHFDDAFLTNFTMDEHLGFFRQVHASLPDLEIEQVQKTGPTSARFVLVSGKTGARVQGSFTIEAQPPHRFTDLGFEPVTAK